MQKLGIYSKKNNHIIHSLYVDIANIPVYHITVSKSLNLHYYEIFNKKDHIIMLIMHQISKTTNLYSIIILIQQLIINHLFDINTKN